MSINVAAPKAQSLSPQNASETARYVAEMAGELESLAASSGLDLLAYFLRLTKAEAQSSALAARSGTPRSADRHRARRTAEAGAAAKINRP